MCRYISTYLIHDVTFRVIYDNKVKFSQNQAPANVGIRYVLFLRFFCSEVVYLDVMIRISEKG